jgi:DNA-directed RNA polymerase specialized sigma24 family protein
MGASDEDRTMATANSVTRWIDQLKQGDREAVSQLWERYFTRLVRLARRWSPCPPTTGAASAEDVALEAFASFCRRAEGDGFARLFDRDDLWQLLVVLAFRKRCNQIQHERRQRRRPAGGRVYVTSALEQDGGEQALLMNMLGREPDPALVAQAAEESQRLLAELGDEELRRVALWKMEGFANEEIAAKLGRAVPTVERKLARIRRLWEKELTP